MSLIIKNGKIHRVKNLIKIVIIGIFFICVLWTWREQIHSEPLRNITHSGLIVAGQSGLASLIYNPSKQVYEKRAETALSDITKDAGAYPRQVITLDKYTFVNLGNEIMRLDSKFRKSVSKKFSSIGAIATDNKNIFVAAEGSFIAFNKDLKELSRVKFDGFIPERKNVHSIIIHKNTAYLIDNRLRPLFLFQVDISNPKHTQITQKIGFKGVNAHLNNQWLNLELNQWLIIESYGRSKGAGQVVNIYSLDSAKAITRKEIWTFSRRNYYDFTYDEGIVKIDANQRFVNVSLIKPEEVTLTMKIYYEYHKVTSTENIILNKNKMSYQAKGFDNPSLVITGVEVYTNEKLVHKGKFYRQKGNKIVSITNFSPAWAIINDRDGFYLAQVDSKNNEVTFSNLFELDYIGTGPGIRQQEDCLFIHLYNKEKGIPEIEIFNIEQPAQVINSVNLNQLNIGRITDFYPY